jgi:hypothetical protein
MLSKLESRLTLNPKFFKITSPIPSACIVSPGRYAGLQIESAHSSGITIKTAEAEGFIEALEWVPPRLALTNIWSRGTREAIKHNIYFTGEVHMTQSVITVVGSFLVGIT